MEIESEQFLEKIQYLAKSFCLIRNRLVCLPWLKIEYLNVVLSFDENILRFDVSVQKTCIMQILKSFNYISKYFSCFFKTKNIYFVAKHVCIYVSLVTVLV